MIRICIFLFWLFPVFLSPEESPVKQFRWPLNINNGYSSSFQEFRSNHFHGGMDLRTFRKTGYPVFAMADGKIVKIRVVKRGSGRGLYVKHQDGYTSIFFHLDRFTPDLENIVRTLQKKTGKKYFGNHELKKAVEVRKGDLIAYSGETGYGLPHLHLEIRDPLYQAVNPFKRVKFPGRDTNFPILRSLMIRNKSEALINGRVGEYRFPFRKTGHSSYHLNEPVVIAGRFDLVLNTRDISDTGKYVAPYEVSLSIDDLNTFHIRFDRFAWEENNQLGFVYDMFYSSPGNFFFNLFSQPGFDLEKKQVDLDRVVDGLSVGPHECRLIVKDNFGNVSSGIFTLYKVEKPLVEIENLRVSDDRIELDIIRLKAISSDEVVLRLQDGRGQQRYSGKLLDANIDEIRHLVLEGIGEKVVFLDFIFKKKGVTYGSRRFCLDREYEVDFQGFEHDIFINHDLIFLILNETRHLADNIELKVSQGNKSVAVKPGEGPGYLYFCFKPSGLEHDIRLDFLSKGKNQSVQSVSLPIRIVHLIQDTEQYFQDGDFSARFFPKTIREPKVLKFDVAHYDSSFPVLSRQISLYPYHFPFLDYVYYQFSKKVENPLQVGIFRFDNRRRKWRYVFTTHDQSTHTFRTKVISSGVFALMRDIYPPEIRSIKTGSTIRSEIRTIVITITDKGKGLNDESLQVQINGKRIECEYDPDRHHVRIHDIRNLLSGRNVIRVSISDYAGNSSSRNFILNLQ
jgi:hypothetical protein